MVYTANFYVNGFQLKMMEDESLRFKQKQNHSQQSSQIVRKIMKIKRKLVATMRFKGKYLLKT